MKMACTSLGLALLLSASSHDPSDIVRVDEVASPDVKRLQPVRTFQLEVPETVHSDGLGPRLVTFDMSENGRNLLTVLGTREYQGDSFKSIDWIELYDIATGERIRREGLDDTDEETLTTGGFLSSEEYYIESGRPESRQPSDTAPGHVRVFSVDPHQVLARLSVGGVTHGQGQYLFSSANRSVVNWKTEESYPAQFHPRFGIQVMTDEGAVLSTNMDGSITLHNPVLDELLHWDSGLESPGVLSTASRGYVIAQGDDFRCKVWKLPGIEQVAQCPRSFGSEGQKRAMAVHPEIPVFALAWDERVRLFHLDPFEMAQEIVVSDPVLGLTLSGDRLIIESRKGFHVWDIENSTLIAEAEVPISHGDNVRVSQNGIVAVVLDKDPDDPESDVRPVWIYKSP